MGQDLNHYTCWKHPYDYKQSAGTCLDEKEDTLKKYISSSSCRVQSRLESAAPRVNYTAVRLNTRAAWLCMNKQWQRNGELLLRWESGNSVWKGLMSVCVCVCVCVCVLLCIGKALYFVGKGFKKGRVRVKCITSLTSNATLCCITTNKLLCYLCKELI